MPDLISVKVTRTVRRALADYEHDEKSITLDANLYEDETSEDAIDELNALADRAVASHTARRRPGLDDYAPQTAAATPATTAADPLTGDAGGSFPSVDPLAGGAATPATAATAEPRRPGRPRKNPEQPAANPATPVADPLAGGTSTPAADPLAGGGATVASTPTATAAAQPTTPATTPASGDAPVTDKQLAFAVAAYTGADPKHLDNLTELYTDVYKVKRITDIPQDKRRGFLAAIAV